MKTALAILLLAVGLTGTSQSGADFTTRTLNDGNVVTSANDWTPPTVDLDAPGGALRGSITLSAVVADRHSDVASVSFQLRPAGEPGWLEHCVVPGMAGDEPQTATCTVDTTGLVDGAYDLRAIAVDTEGNAQESLTLRRTFDNTAPLVSLADPGSPLTGTVSLVPTASDATSGLTSVSVQRSLAGTGAWVEICRSVLAQPCTFDTRTAPDGPHDLRAVATDAAGNEAAAVVAARVVDNAGPVVVLTAPGEYLRGTVTLTVDATDAGSGVASVRIQRALSGTTTWTDVCTRTAAPYTCTLNTTTLANDDYDLRAVATDNLGQVTTSAIVEVTVDNGAPTVSMIDPGSPIRGTIDLRANADDAVSGIASVTIQRAPAGTTTWTAVCTDTTSPYSCRFNSTTVPDGLYDFRAIAVDLAGNSATSATVRNRQIDNTVSAVSLADPGELLRGIELLQADASSTAGVTSVRIDRAPAGTTTWTTICTDTVAPYECTWDTTTVANGLYDLRAVLLDGAGKTTISATVANRRVDNSPVRGLDVQAFNRTGGTLGKIETGDSLVLTYSEEIQPGSIISGWNGSTRNVVFRARDGKLLGLGGNDDTLDVFTDTSLATPVRVGSVRTGIDHMKGGKTAIFNATITRQQVIVDGKPVSTFTIVLGSLISGDGLRTPGAGTMVWTPSAAALDLAGIACSTAPVTESGPLDRDF